jgi:small subunit ribosomal protein S6
LSGFLVRAIEPRGGSILRRYETIFISLADMSADETNELVERYKSIVTSLDGKIIRAEFWGKRKLAYPIEKRKEGFYVLFNFVGESKVVSEIERNFKIDEKILRYQTVKLSDQVDLEEIEKEIAEAQKKEPAPVVPPSVEKREEEGSDKAEDAEEEKEEPVTESTEKEIEEEKEEGEE